MKNENYIKLTQVGGSEVYINYQLIIAMSPDKDKTFITTMSNKTFIVTETVDEIFTIINKAKMWTIMNYNTSTTNSTATI
jgi:uncharacterized protein YlzI (FlbEa/FlbD family)